MKRVTGLGGIFFKCKDPSKMKSWYEKHLGFKTDEYGGAFEWRQKTDPAKSGYTAWSPMKEDTEYFNPSDKQFMINYRVEDLEKLLEVLKAEGVQILGEIETYDYGKFAHILDLEGNKIELWEPVDTAFDEHYKGNTIH